MKEIFRFALAAALFSMILAGCHRSASSEPAVTHPEWMKDAVVCVFNPDTDDPEILRETGADVFVDNETWMIPEECEMEENPFDAECMAGQAEAWAKVAVGELNAKGLGDFYVDFGLKAEIPAETIPVNFLPAAVQDSADSKVLRQFAALSFTVPGAPMASINTADEDMVDFYRELIEMRDSHSCLWAQPWGGLMAILPTSEPEKVFAFEREAEGDLCLAMFNFSPEEVTYKVENHLVTIDSEFTLPAHGCHIIFSVGDCFGDCDETETAD